MDPIALRASAAPALITDDGRLLSHRELLRLAERFSRIFPEDRKCLIGLLGDRELGTVAAYVAALRHGHAVAWLGAARNLNQQIALVDRYAPEVMVGPAVPVRAAVGTGRYALQPNGLEDVHVAAIKPQHRGPEVGANTSVLLLTSGSMSGGRAVRLSAESIAANTSAITAALGIDNHSRAATSLPLFYTYGLSVLNSHLAARGSILITTAPATGVQFWRLFAETGCDSFAGVPVHFDWLARSRLPFGDAASLRKLTVAGGALRTSLARQLHQDADDAGRRFFKMYGQTEVTARISILQHEDFPAHSESVGTVVAGGNVTIDQEADTEHTDPRVGSIVYHGSSAMQGYADSRTDLTKPDEMRGRVDTGDLGYLQGEFLHLVGREGRFIKPDGKRLALDAVEEIFAELAPAAVIGSADDRAHVFVEPAPTDAINELRTELLHQLNLGPRAIQVHAIGHLPRRPSGKIDYGLLHNWVSTHT